MDIRKKKISEYRLGKVVEELKKDLGSHLDDLTSVDEIIRKSLKRTIFQIVELDIDELSSDPMPEGVGL